MSATEKDHRRFQPAAAPERIMSLVGWELASEEKQAQLGNYPGVDQSRFGERISSALFDSRLRSSEYNVKGHLPSSTTGSLAERPVLAPIRPLSAAALAPGIVVGSELVECGRSRNGSSASPSHSLAANSL